MSLVNSFKTAGGVAAGTYALGFTPTVGNTLILCGHMTATVNTLTGATLGAGRSFTTPPSLDAVADAATSENVYCISRVVQSGDASSVTFTTSAGNMYFYVLEVSGLVTPETSGFEAATHVTNSASTVHTSSFIAANANDFVVTLNRYTGGGPGTISGITAGYTQLANGRAGTDFFYSNDIGVSGSKSFSWSSNSLPNVAHIYAFKSAVTDPTVSTVTGTTVTEGGSIVYTVTLSGATNRTTNYAASFTGGTATGADYDSALGNATYSAGVTFSGGNMVVPTAVSSFTFTVATTQDTLDEADETVFPTVGGVAAVTGTITDNDPAPTVTFSDGVESFGVVTCVATLGAVSGKDTSFQVDTANGTKTAGTNYTAIVAQTVTIPAGSLTAAITANTL